MSNVKIYLVGGAVRDKILGLQSKDLDYVVTGLLSFQELKNFVTHELKCEIKVETPKYGVVRCVHPRLGGLDFALPRIDFNQDGRQSNVKFVETIEEDLARRDFTMNAMAYEVDRNLHIIEDSLIDPFGGYKDVQDKLVRFVGNPHERIKEDELRILRALRFCITKDFTLDALSSDCIYSVQISDKVSNERIVDELNKMFAVSANKTIKALEYGNQLKLLDRINLKSTIIPPSKNLNKNEFLIYDFDDCYKLINDRLQGAFPKSVTLREVGMEFAFDYSAKGVKAANTYPLKIIIDLDKIKKNINFQNKFPFERLVEIKKQSIKQIMYNKQVVLDKETLSYEKEFFQALLTNSVYDNTK